jgi:hypothetical protein
MDRERRVTARGGPPKPSGRPSTNLMRTRQSATTTDATGFVPFGDDSGSGSEKEEGDMFAGILKPAQPRSRARPN